HLVACGMAVGVVDFLEVVDVQQQQRHRVPAPRRTRDKSLKLAGHVAAVVQTRQGV
uniref:Transposase n=1 Tax=Parastrongyloides trichosuri TaxID=131310 RepID=A0A0N5A0M9_PARTI